MAQARRSAFFFSGQFLPVELANFNLQNVPLRDRKGAILEMVGHGVSVWWPSRRRSDFVDLADAARAWFRTIAASYYLETTVALEPALTGWVEALDSQSTEAVIGFADPRFVKISATDESAEVNRAMLRSVSIAQRLRRERGELERATHEALAAANDGTAQSYLSAYRALECLRRNYEPSVRRVQQGWSMLRTELGLDLDAELATLRDAAQAVRHGDVPSRQSEAHVVNRARQRRKELLEFTRRTVRAAVEQRL